MNKKEIIEKNINRIVNIVNSSLIDIFKEIKCFIWSIYDIEKSKLSLNSPISRYSFYFKDISTNYVHLNIYYSNDDFLEFEVSQFKKKLVENSKEKIIFSEKINYINLEKNLAFLSNSLVNVIKSNFKVSELSIINEKIIDYIKLYYIELNSKILVIKKIVDYSFSRNLFSEDKKEEYININYFLIDNYEIEIEFKIEDYDINNLKISCYMTCDYEESKNSLLSNLYIDLDNIFIDKKNIDNPDTIKIKDFFSQCEEIIKNLLF